MEALSKIERYTLAGLFANFILQFLLFAFNGFKTRKFGTFYPYTYEYDVWFHLKYYDITEFLVYGITPLAIFAIYYFLLRKK